MARLTSRQRLQAIQDEAISAGEPLTPTVAATLVLADTLIDTADQLEIMAGDMERRLDQLGL
jgi:hypothetical protein